MLPNFRLVAATFFCGFLIVFAGLRLAASLNNVHEAFPVMAAQAAPAPAMVIADPDLRRGQSAVPVIYDLRFAVSSSSLAPQPAGPLTGLPLTIAFPVRDDARDLSPADAAPSRLNDAFAALPAQQADDPMPAEPSLPEVPVVAMPEPEPAPATARVETATNAEPPAAPEAAAASAPASEPAAVAAEAAAVVDAPVVAEAAPVAEAPSMAEAAPAVEAPTVAEAAPVAEASPVIQAPAAAEPVVAEEPKAPAPQADAPVAVAMIEPPMLSQPAEPATAAASASPKLSTPVTPAEAIVASVQTDAGLLPEPPVTLSLPLPRPRPHIGKAVGHTKKAANTKTANTKTASTKTAKSKAVTKTKAAAKTKAPEKKKPVRVARQASQSNQTVATPFGAFTPLTFPFKQP